ncbi:MAG TPA: 30S ribosomal protein S17e [Candidatus Nanoarchaeia archaeon]|nr:30S ribosomal protein S17e [Candidatus Nanoarchaeia archaeon]
MGKIKSKLVRRTAHTLLERGVEFSEKFDENKGVLRNTMPSKKLRNQIAGFLARIKKQQRIAEEKLAE